MSGSMSDRFGHEYCVVHDQPLEWCRAPARCREIMKWWGEGLYGTREDLLTAYDKGIARLMQSVGVLPRYTLHAHPSVITALKNLVGPSGEYTAFDDLLRLYPLTGIDVFPEEGWEAGRYELRKNGEVRREGTLRDA